MKKKESDFGQGLVYCLGLFLAHTELDLNSGLAFGPHLWFNAASDHLYDIIIPNSLPTKLKDRLNEFKNKCLELGHGLGIEAKPEDKEWAVREAKSLLIEIDKLLRVPTIEATWS